MNAQFFNLTPHPIRIADKDGNITHEFPSVGQFRVPVNKRLFTVLDGIPVSKSEFMLPSELPEEQDGVYYIVSTPAASAIKRKDFIAPDCGHTAIRKDGQVYAVRSFLTF